MAIIETSKLNSFNKYVEKHYFETLFCDEDVLVNELCTPYFIYINYILYYS